MKVLLILLVLFAVAYYFFVYEKAPGKKETAPAEATAGAAATPAAATANGSFDGVVALLRTEMSAVPVPLDGPGPALANAQSIRRKVRPYVSTHAEYAALTEACDLIIQANAQRGAFQDGVLPVGTEPPGVQDRAHARHFDRSRLAQRKIDASPTPRRPDTGSRPPAVREFLGHLPRANGSPGAGVARFVGGQTSLSRWRGRKQGRFSPACRHAAVPCTIGPGIASE